MSVILVIWDNSTDYLITSKMILAFESSYSELSVALVGTDKHWQRVTVLRPHSQFALHLVQELIEDATVSLQDITGVAFGRGPGAFTGVRLACGLAHGWAMASRVPIFGVSSLFAMAVATEANTVLVIQDARMGEFYLAAYERISSWHWREVVAPVLVTSSYHVEFSLKKIGTLIGNGCTAWLKTQEDGGEDATGNLHVLPIYEAKALDIGQWVMHQGRLEGEVNADNSEPIYARKKVALSLVERLSLQI